VQGELKQKAHEIGCDMVLARSALSLSRRKADAKHQTLRHSVRYNLHRLLAFMTISAFFSGKENHTIWNMRTNFT
jgi:hypothetical protein